MIPIVWMLAASTLAPLSPTDRAEQAAIRRAVGQLENGKIRQSRFEQLLPRSHIPTWQRIQRQIPSTRSGSADLAFVLAYYGVEYRHNLDRLLLPYRRWRQALASPAASGGSHDAAVVESLPDDLRLLYLKHHDIHSLGALLGMQLDGAYSENQMGVLQQLWNSHAVEMLRAAAGSPVRLGNIAEMLAGENEKPADERAVLAELRPFTRHHDQRVAQAAERVVFLVKAVYSRYSSP